MALHMLAGELKKAGYTTDFDPPEERHSGGQDAVSGLVTIGLGVAESAGRMAQADDKGLHGSSPRRRRTRFPSLVDHPKSREPRR